MDLSVRISDFEDGTFPDLCVVTGSKVCRLRRERATFQPTWPLVFWLIGPWGWLVALVAYSGLARHVDGWLPIADDVVDRVRGSRRNGWRLAGAGAVVAAAGFALAFTPVRTTGVFLLVIGVALALAGGWRVQRPAGAIRIRLAANGRTVCVRDVSDVFADAYEEQERRRLQTRIAP